jgi:preprotein translocase subunit SecE
LVQLLPYLLGMTTPVKFLQETYGELKQVVWPTKQEVLRLTLIVITISVLVAAYIGVLDVLFAKLMEAVLR